MAYSSYWKLSTIDYSTGALAQPSRRFLIDIFTPYPRPRKGFLPQTNWSTSGVCILISHFAEIGYDLTQGILSLRKKKCVVNLKIKNTCEIMSLSGRKHDSDVQWHSEVQSSHSGEDDVLP